MDGNWYTTKEWTLESKSQYWCPLALNEVKNLKNNCYLNRKGTYGCLCRRIAVAWFRKITWWCRCEELKCATNSVSKSLRCQTICRYISISKQLTPWNRVLEKLIVTKLIKKYPAFYGTRRYITVFTRARHWSLSWTRRIQSTPSPPSVLILSSHLRPGLLLLILVRIFSQHFFIERTQSMFFPQSSKMIFKKWR